MRQQEEDEHTRVLYDLCSMIIQIFRTPPLPISFPRMVGVGPSSWSSPSSSSTTPPPQSQVSPATFAALFLGISMALMLFGSVTFVIGFLLMPLVITLVFLFYFAGMVSNLSEFGRSILWGSSDYKLAPGWDYSTENFS